MEPAASAIGAYLRTHKDEICQVWEADVRAELEALRVLAPSALVDHLPEVLDAIADWVDGRETEAQRGFEALSVGHALQRLGHGVDADTLASEYSRLRQVLLRHLLAIPATGEVREELIRLDAALDLAVNDAMRIYTRRLDAIRERFVAILAHDLRTPLGSVRLSAETLLEQEGISDRTTALAARIVRGAARMQRIIDSVIEFARGTQGGGIPAAPMAMDMAVVCHLAADELRAAHPGLQVNVEVAGDLRGAWDSERVHQALTNLLSNAAHHGGGSPVTVRAWETEDRRHVLTSVNNGGDPIPAESMPTLFEPFMRPPAARQGLGLGLAIVRMIVAAHGGRVEVTSTPAEGTTFTIVWPRVPLEETPTRPLA